MAADMSQTVDQIIANDPDLKKQYEKSVGELKSLLDMLNIRLVKKKLFCSVYTMTARAGSDPISFTVQ